MLLLIAATTGCVSNDQPSVHLVTAYQLRGATSGAQDPRRVDNLDGLGGTEITCKLGDKTTDIEFSAAATDETWQFALESKGSDCTFIVKEDNTYERECKISEGKSVDCSNDDVEDPCQVAIEVDGSTAKGHVCCKALPIQGMNPQKGDYSIFAPGSGDKPVTFTIYNCD
jgi:hypothetical protein